MKTTLEEYIGKTNTPKSAALFLSFTTMLFASFSKGVNTASAACDVSSWKYCNPLEGTISTLSEAGVKSVQALLGLIGTIALLFLVVAGLTYMTAAGDVAKIESAKKIVTGTVIGLGIALIAYSLLITVSEIMGVK